LKISLFNHRVERKHSGFRKRAAEAEEKATLGPTRAVRRRNTHAEGGESGRGKMPERAGERGSSGLGGMRKSKVEVFSFV